jgi:hypothetical protein
MSESEDRPPVPETADAAGTADVPDTADVREAPDVREGTGGAEPAGPSWWWRQRRWTVPVAVAAVLGGAFTGGWFAAPPDDAYAPGLAASQPATVTLAQARDSQNGPLSGWPTLGDHAGDRSQARTAMEIWLGSGSAPHTRLFNLGPLDDEFGARLDSPTGRVLFSGTAAPGGPRVSVVQAGNQLLQYEGGRGGIKFVYDAPAPAAMSYADGPPMALDWDDQSSGPFTLALPPWLKNVQMEGFQGKDATWRPLKSTDGVSAPLHMYPSATGGTGVEPSDDCGRGVLLRAEDTSESGPSHPRVATFVYKPGWPYAVRLTYFPKPGLSSYEDGDDAAPVDQPYMLRMASSLLCGDGGVKDFQPASEVSWTQMWQGRPDAGAGREAVLHQEVTYPKGGSDFADEDYGDSVREIGIDKASDYHDLTADSEDTQEVEVACMPAGKKLAVVGPANATQVRLLDAVSGREWSAHGNFLTAPASQLPKDRSRLTAFTVTPGKNGGVTSALCANPGD